MSFDAGDLFTLVSKDADGWWRVKRNDREMYVPASYMEVVEKQEEDVASEVADVEIPGASAFCAKNVTLRIFAQMFTY